MGSSTRWRVAVIGAGVVVTVSGCSAESAGQPAAEPATASTGASSAPSTPSGPRTVASISPCDDLTTVNVIALAVDPATKQDTSIRGQKVADRGCGWTGKDILVDVHVTNATVALYQSRSDFVNVQLRTVAGLPSLSSQLRDDPGGCRVISDIPGGGLIAQVRIKGEHEAAVGVDSCTAAVRVMEQVAPVLLKAK